MSISKLKLRNKILECKDRMNSEVMEKVERLKIKNGKFLFEVNYARGCYLARQ